MCIKVGKLYKSILCRKNIKILNWTLIITKLIYTTILLIKSVTIRHLRSAILKHRVGIVCETSVYVCLCMCSSVLNISKDCSELVPHPEPMFLCILSYTVSVIPFQVTVDVPLIPKRGAQGCSLIMALSRLINTNPCV